MLNALRFRRISAVIAIKLKRVFAQFAQRLNTDHWQLDHAVIGFETACDGLSDPPIGIGAEFIAALRIEFFNAACKTYAALLHKIIDGHRFGLDQVALGGKHDQSQIGTKEFVVCAAPDHCRAPF